MEPGSQPAANWRGWAADGGGANRPVTSTRLGSGARPRNRLFPKTRSWFALDAPLELLSPLSVLRVLFALAVVSWPLIGLTSTTPEWGTDGIIAVTASTAVVWLCLLRARKIDLHASRVLVGYWTAAVALLTWCSHGSAASGLFVTCLAPIAVFTALFLGRRAVVAQLAGSTVGVALALLATQGVGRALILALAACALASAAPLTVLLLTRSARRHDTLDPDTGLPNGFGLAQKLSSENQTAFLVAAVVLEGIDVAREALGYQVGTEILRRAVEDLGQVLPAGATIGRVDGDELVVTLGLAAVDSAEGTPLEPKDRGLGPRPDEVAGGGGALAGTLVRAIAAGRYLVGTVDIPLAAHVGLSSAPRDGTDVAELVRRASLSARRAEERGVPVVHWGGDVGTLTIEDLEMLTDLRQAPVRGELSLAYQPQIGRLTGSPLAVEALLRWERGGHGQVAPGRFIPLAERVGLINELTEWVVGEALDAQVRWRRGGVDLPVSVNVSAKSMPVPGLAGWILAALDERDLPTSCLTIEVTETAVADPVQADALLRPLHQHGVRVSIDDFGTGFTSLALLPELPLDELKVDQCFVLRSPTSPADEAIVRTIGELGHRLGLHVVAEGVETAEIADRMIAMGIDLLQGYHFAKPMAEPDLLAHLARSRGRPPTPTMVVRQTPASQPHSPV